MVSELISYCGLYCGACSFRLSVELNDRNHILKMPSVYDGLKNDEFELCPGCRLENKCGECAIRDCAVSKNLAHCGECEQFPCERITAFAQDGKPHHAEILDNFKLLAELGQEKWLTHMEEKWKCCDCGKKYSWYYRVCTCK